MATWFFVLFFFFFPPPNLYVRLVEYHPHVNIVKIMDMKFELDVPK